MSAAESAARLSVAATLALVVGCSGGTVSGAPRPDAGSVPADPTSTSATGGSLRDLDPCAVILPAEARALGGQEHGEQRDLGTSRGCTWIVQGSHVFGVAFFDSKGIDELTITEPRVPVTVNGRRAERVESDSPGLCAVFFPIDDSSVAAADVKARDDTAKACQVAEQVARIIEPRLP